MKNNLNLAGWLSIVSAVVTILLNLFGYVINPN